MHNRRNFCRVLLGGGVAAGAFSFAGRSQAAVNLLPLTTSFRGEKRFADLAAKASREGWRRYAMGPRMALIGQALVGTPYVGFTLEIDDKIECPSANFNGLDCWTFFETVLGFARMLEEPKAAYAPEDLLRQIEWTRYRGGKCSGGYLERIHYLNEWYWDNAARGNIVDLTKSMSGAERLVGRRSSEMTTLWRSYRYLKKNPSLLKGMAQVESRVNALPVWYIPKGKVTANESKLQNGDIIGLVDNGQGGVCGHVGLCIKTKDGKTRLMHASSKHRKVVLEESLTGYLYRIRSDIGILVGRPLATSSAVYDYAQYQANLRRLAQG